MQNSEVLKDKTIQRGKWEFNQGVTSVFDDMLSRSIPQYDEMRRLCFVIGQRYVQNKTTILDLGCSRGEALAPFVEKYGAYNQYTGIDISEPMLSICRDRFSGLIKCGVVDIRSCDLRSEFPPVRASLVLSILTIQFTPIEYRLKILSNIYRSMHAGGALIFVEKVIGGTADLDSVMVDSYLSMKKENGYSQEEIDRKRLSLEGVLVPVTARWNEELLRLSGFTSIDCFWRWMNFAGWIAVKN